MTSNGMAPRRLLAAALTAGFLAFGLTPASAQQAAPPVFTEQQRAAIREIVRDFILKNPEIMIEAQTELEKRQREAERQARLPIIQDKSGPLYAAAHNVSLGNPGGDVTLVEFFDYNCGFCKRALRDLQRIVAEDKNVRVIVKDFPVLGQGSVEAASVALALKQQASPEKFWQFHQELLSARGQVGRQQALDAARKVGVDMARLQRDAEAQSVRDAIEQNVKIADSLGLTGTPSYVLGTTS